MIEWIRYSTVFYLTMKVPINVKETRQEVRNRQFVSCVMSSGYILTGSVSICRLTAVCLRVMTHQVFSSYCIICIRFLHVFIKKTRSISSLLYFVFNIDKYSFPSEQIKLLEFSVDTCTTYITGEKITQCLHRLNIAMKCRYYQSHKI